MSNVGRAKPYKQQNSRAICWLLSLGLTITWWIPYYPLPFLEFYKEWVFVISIALAALALRPTPYRVEIATHPMVLASASLLLILVWQAVNLDGVWPHAVLTAAYIGFFVFCLLVGQRLRFSLGSKSLCWITGCLLVAALGSCLFAALQLNWIQFEWPLLAARAGNRISGNIAQANHFADLLWLGCVAAIYLQIEGYFGRPILWLATTVMLFFSHLSGSRMIWLYAGLMVIIAIIFSFRNPNGKVRRATVELLILAVFCVATAATISATSVLELFDISSSSQRLTSADGAQASSARLWLWKAGIASIWHSPFYGVGAGRFVGSTYELAMQVSDSPVGAADVNAHNMFLQLAAEEGAPVSLLVAVSVFLWLRRAIRLSRKCVDALVVLTLCCIILIHANLEYPLWYAYFLGIFGLIVGNLPRRLNTTSSHNIAIGGTDIVDLMSVLVLAIAALAYVQFRYLEQAMQRVVMQVQLGAAPQRDETLETMIASLPRWSPYRDYAEAILLITALPIKDDPENLAERCERAVFMGPSPYLLARCATALQVAGKRDRATYFADSLCKLNPSSDLVLIESMNYVQATSPEAGNLKSTCVERRE